MGGGGGGIPIADWNNYKSAAQTKTKSQTFTRQSTKKTNDPRTSFDPTTITVRESRDSKDSPNATPVILAFDVSGTMGGIPYYFVKEGFGTLMNEIYDRKPVSDPHIMCMAFGDARCDQSALQVTQFEADIRIVKQLEDFYLEAGGGGNGGESYNLPWYFAATKTSTDSLEKRGKKGLLFTIGDEPPHDNLTAAQIKRFVGGEVKDDLTSKQILDMVRRQYDVYHIVVEQGDGLGQYGEQAVIGAWNKLLGEGHVIRLSDYTKLSEVVISTIQHNAGIDHDAIVKSWDGTTGMVVANALPKTALRPAAKAKGGVLRLDDATPK